MTDGVIADGGGDITIVLPSDVTLESLLVVVLTLVSAYAFPNDPKAIANNVAKTVSLIFINVFPHFTIGIYYVTDCKNRLHKETTCK